MTPRTMQKVRRYHLYLGIFFAPAILLFSLSGAFQTFRLQEEKGYGGAPPGWIVWLASVHKDQRLPRAPEEHKPTPAGARPPAPKPAGKPPFKLPLQIFTVLMAIGLMLSALLGIVIALNNRATRRMSVAMLAAGAVLPLLLLLL